MIDTDVLYSPGFVILTLGAWGASALGYHFSGSMGEQLELWKLMVIMVVEVIACYYFAAKD